MRTRTLPAVLVLSAIAGCAPVQEPQLGASTAIAREASVRRLDGSVISSDVVDATVNRLIAAAHVPGLALAVVNDGQIVLAKGYGYRNVEKGEPMTADTVMAGASFTKAAFAVAVLQLVDEGKLNLDRPVAELFEPSLTTEDDYRDLAGDARFGLITPRMLLSHTGGFPNWRRFNDDGKLDIKAEPGSRYMYSGEGITLLQRAFHRITGQSTTEVMRERVFAPFGMTRTSMVWQPELAAEAAVGYDAEGRALGHSQREHPDAAGSMDTTARDWAQLLCGLLRGDGLSRAGRDEMLRAQVRIRSKRQFPTTATETTDENDGIRLSYGLGWGLLWSPYGKAFFKEGHDDGFQSYAITFDEARTAIVIMTNSDNGESLYKELLETVIGDTFTPWRWEGYVPYQQLAR
jgi:CubicO group peptidase (beta-lactamase class C family)